MIYPWPSLRLGSKTAVYKHLAKNVQRFSQAGATFAKMDIIGDLYSNPVLHLILNVD